MFKVRKTTLSHNEIINLFVVYKINLWLWNINTKLALRNTLFGAVGLAKSSYSYNSCFGYSFGFDARVTFPLAINSGLGKNEIIFAGVNSSSVLDDNGKKDISIPGKISTGEAEYSVNFNE